LEFFFHFDPAENKTFSHFPSNLKRRFFRDARSSEVPMMACFSKRYENGNHGKLLRTIRLIEVKFTVLTLRAQALAKNPN
jgi:hypothetical protein